MPYLTIFVLVRDGVPVYASRNPQFVKNIFHKKLMDRGYPIEMIEKVRFVRDESFFPMFQAKHPYLKEVWHVFQVDAD